MSNEIESQELVVPTPLSPEHQFLTLTTDQKLEAIYALQLDNQKRIDGALTIIDEVGRELGPILESLQANPMFKMMGFGKRL